MPAVQRERAERVVEIFRAQLEPETSQAIGDKGFADLTELVREALHEERAEVAGQFEALAKAMRAASEQVDIGL